MRKALLILGSALVLFSTSCKKDDSEGTSVTVQTLAGNYKLTKLTVKSGSTAETVVPFDDFLDDCQKDDIYTLNTNMSYVEVDAGVSCNYGNYESDWSLTNTTTIVIDGDTYTIRKFDGKNLELMMSETYNGVTASIVFFYTKQ